MKHPLTDGGSPGEWRDDNQERRRLLSLAEKRLAEAEALAQVTRDEIKNAKQALEAAKRRLGL